MKITFMRHGETDWNLAKKIQGIQPVPINTTGIRQIEQTSHFFRIQPGRSGFQFSQLITSPLLRARQSASICSEVLHVLVCVQTDFRERSFGALEGKTHTELKLQFGIVDVEEVEDGRYGIEPVSELDKRLARGIEILKTNYKDEHVLVVTHGSVIKRIAALHGVQTDIIPNGSFVQLDL
jgi:uncharacterized phosphatase